MHKIQILIADDDPAVIRDIIMDLLPCISNMLSPERRVSIISDAENGLFTVECFNLAMEAELAIKNGFKPDIALIDINFSNYKGKRKLSVQQRKKELSRYRGIDTILFIKEKCPDCVVAGYTHFGSDKDIFNKLKENGFILKDAFERSNPSNVVYHLLKDELPVKGNKNKNIYYVSHFFKDVLTHLAVKYYVNLSSGSKKIITSLVRGKAGWRSDSEKILLQKVVETKDGRKFQLLHLLLCKAVTITDDRTECVQFSELKEFFLELKEADKRAVVNLMPEAKGDWALPHMQNAFNDFLTDFREIHPEIEGEAVKLCLHFFKHCCEDGVVIDHSYRQNFRCDSFINQKLTNQNFFKKYKNNIILRLAISVICEVNYHEHVRYVDRSFKDRIINLFIIFIENDILSTVQIENRMENQELYKQFFMRLGLRKKKNEQLVQTSYMSGLEHQMISNVLEKTVSEISRTNSRVRI